jgi:hypothetical protein
MNQRIAEQITESVRSLVNIKIPDWFSEVTINDLNNLNLDVLPENLLLDTNTSIKSFENVVSDQYIQEKIEESFPESDLNAPNRSNKLEVFFKKLLEAAKYDLALQAMCITLQILIAITLGIAEDDHDIEIKNEIQSIIKDSTYGKAYQRIFINENIEYPLSEVGYLRTDTLIREGAKQTAPVNIHEIIPHKTVVTILTRKGNWIKILISDKDHYYTGWVEKSKVVKFKK